MNILRSLVASLLLAIAAILPSDAVAQSGCAIFTQGNVPTPGQWNQCLQLKQDLLGYTAVNRAGDGMTGRLSTTASTTFRSGFAIVPGVAPSAPVDGDIWTTTVGIFARINGATIGPLSATGSSIPSVVQGDTLFASGVNTIAALAKNTTATRALCNTGTNNNPAWCQINLANGVTGALPLANLATGTQDTALGYFGSTAASAATLPNCSGALTYNTSTHVFGCNASGAVIASGTPVVNQIAQWLNATTIQGVNLVSLLSAGGGISLTGTTTVTVALANNGSTLSTTVTNPTGTNSTSPLMMGLGATCKITPGFSSRVEIEVVGVTSNNTGGTTTGIRLAFGTGAAPANGAAASGTLAGSILLPTTPVANTVTPFKTGAILTGRTPGVQVWFDIQLNVDTGSSAISGLVCNAKEI